jgi:phosphoribosylglycinamide formyltransferase-1
MTTKLNIAVLASHSGTTLQSIIDACESGVLQARVCLVISNNSGATAAERAKRHAIPFCHLSSRTHPDSSELDRAVCDALDEHGSDLVMLAGYMKKLGRRTIERFSGRILNTHPALLPNHGGQGMYGDNVHEAVIAARETETGVTIHLVDTEYDEGPIVAQCRIPVLPEDDAHSLAARVQQREKPFLIETLQSIADGSRELPLSATCG